MVPTQVTEKRSVNKTVYSTEERERRYNVSSRPLANLAGRCVETCACGDVQVWWLGVLWGTLRVARALQAHLLT